MDPELECALIEEIADDPAIRKRSSRLWTQRGKTGCYGLPLVKLAGPTGSRSHHPAISPNRHMSRPIHGPTEKSKSSRCGPI